MIKYVTGDLLQSPAQTLVNPVNTVGAMGKGLALVFKNKYPNMFHKYKRACDEHLVTPGSLMLCKEFDHWILLFPTKRHWKDSSKIEYVEAGLQKFRNAYQTKGITSIAFPKLGCGCGGLNWNTVQPLMEKYLSDLPITIYIYI